MKPDMVNFDWKPKNSVAFVAFAKNPDLVPVKTRLAKSLGQEAASRIYVAMLEDCLEGLFGCNGIDTYVACYPNEKDEFFDALSKRSGVKLIKQVGADLGERMFSCIRQLLEHHNTVFLFGTDLPVLPLESVMNLLNNAYWDVALGPSVDGGYYTIGFRKVTDGLFDDVAWSTNSAFVQTVSNCVKAGLEVIFLELCSDIDDEGSLKMLCDDIEHNNKHAPNTRATLEALGLVSKYK